MAPKTINKFFTWAMLAIIYNSLASAMPSSRSSIKPSTHRVKSIGPDQVQIVTYHTPSTYETFGEGLVHQLSKRTDLSIEEVALKFISSQLNIDISSIKFKSSHTGETAKYVYVEQIHNGIPFANAVANVALNNDNKVVAFGSSFVHPKSIASSIPSLSVEAAISKAEQALHGKYNGWPTALQYFAKQDGTIVLTHGVQIRNEGAGTWYEAFVDAHSGELVSLTDFASKASYKVIPIQKQDPTEGFETLTNPQDTTASPQGWHSTGILNTVTTDGNNVVAYKDLVPATQSSAPLNFIYTQDPTQSPETRNNTFAAIVNAFYVANTVHDFTYRYGFTETSFNYQVNNFGKGGRQNDVVEISVQDPSGFNNAGFYATADGQPGLMVMFLWNKTTPKRDGALENDILVHEYTHGITNRLTGRSQNSCLQSLESGGLGEGWSDAMAEYSWTEKNSNAVPDFRLGTYVYNNTAGLRRYPYSTSATTNPLRYSNVSSFNEVHDIGQIWANMLHNVYAALVAAHGWSSTARTNPTGSEGNIVFLHHFIDGLLLQPCNPTFLNARDAWIQADANRYNGANKCLLWRAFASRGLGVNAANYRDDSSVPTGC